MNLQNTDVSDGAIILGAYTCLIGQFISQMHCVNTDFGPISHTSLYRRHYIQIYPSSREHGYDYVILEYIIIFKSE